MLMEDKIGHWGIGWCSHSDLCLPWHILYFSPPPLHPSLPSLSLFASLLIIPSFSPAHSPPSPFCDSTFPVLQSLSSLLSFDDSWILLFSSAQLPLSNSSVVSLLLVIGVKLRQRKPFSLQQTICRGHNKPSSMDHAAAERSTKR